jgi:adenosylcobinamide-GDP ribazoletransferase
MLKSFLLALQFLTIIPIRIKQFDEIKFANALIYFPFVGVLLALLLAVISNALSWLGISSFAVNTILIVVLIILTGAMHLDGLSDTFDALSSGKDREKMLEIMRDSHCGVVGVVSVICCILLKISFLSSLNYIAKINILILMCALSRWSLIFLIFSFPYARQEGKLKRFSTGINTKIFVLATLIALIFVFASFRLAGLLVMIFCLIFAFIFAKFISNKIGGITGDSLGAACELSEITVLVVLIFLGKAGCHG